MTKRPDRAYSCPFIHGLLKVSRVFGGKQDIGANITKLFDGATDRKSPAASLKALYGYASNTPRHQQVPLDRCVSSSRSALGTAVNPSYPRPWANRITRWRANLGSLGKIGHRSETGARVIGEQRARGSPLCRSQFVQSPVDCLGNRSVCSRRSLLRRSLPRRSTTRVHGLRPGTSSRMDTSMSAKSTTVIDSSGNSSQPSSISPDEENTTAPSIPRRHRIRK